VGQLTAVASASSESTESEKNRERGGERREFVTEEACILPICLSVCGD
jgi:hypothetical protein